MYVSLDFNISWQQWFHKAHLAHIFTKPNDKANKTSII